MLTRKTILGMTAAAGIAAVPVLALGQANTGGSSAQPQTTQTMPQQGPVSGPRAADTAPSGSPRDGTPGNPPSTAVGRAVDRMQGETPRPDGTPGNPPGTAAGRAMDRTLGTNTTGADRPAAAVAPASGPLAVDSVRMRDGRRASKVIGSTVYGGDGSDSIGSVDDLIVPRDGGNPVAVLSVGGFLGIGAKLVAVPYERLQYNAERDRWMLPGATKEALTALPTYAYDSERRDRTETGTDRPAARPGAGGGAPAAPAAPPPARTQ